MAISSTDSILNWALKYDTEGEISNLWNADLYEQNGDEYVIRNVGWNFEIAPNQSVTYGYTLSGNALDLPDSFEIYSKRVDKTEGYDVQYNITKSWDTGVEGNIVITNTSYASIEAWTLSFDSNFTIDNLWNGRVLENNGTSYTVAAEMWTNPVQPNGSMTIGFVGSKAADVEALLSNFRLTEVVIGEGMPVIPIDPPVEEIEITANAVYDEGNDNITVSWSTNNPNGSFDILMSEDGENFVSVGTVEGVSEFIYTPENEFETLYFKVVQTIGEQIAESNVVAVAKSEEDIAISAEAVYDEESGIITVSWTTNKENGYFEIFMSEDGENYNSLDIVENANEFIYAVTNDFNVLYFKVKQTIEEKSAESNVVTVLTDEEDDYIDDVMSWDEMVDTDGDGLPDYIEYEYGTDINNTDTDGDGLPDGYEVLNCGTNPALFDSNGNGISDADEDLDGDGLSNIEEYKLGTTPIVKDSDNDGLSDGEEVNIHNTDPLVYDSDSDSICDGDEIIKGLNPNNPATFGVPDSEYTFEQALSADDDVFNLINYDENPFELSLKLNAAGNAENSVVVSKSGYSIVMDNESILGCVPEIYYNKNLKVDNIEISFEISQEYLIEPYSVLNNELTGIHKYNIFTYNEDLNMLMPVATEYDEANSRIYTNVESVGTYFIVDMNKWVSQLGIEPDSASATAYSLSENADEESEYIDVAFLIYTDQLYLNVIKKQLTTTVEAMYSQYDNIRVFFVVYSGSAYVCGLTGNKYAESVEEANNIINRIFQTPDINNLTMVNGFKGVNDLEWRENSQRHCFVIDVLVEPMCKYDMPAFTALAEKNISTAICYGSANSNAAIYKAMTPNTYANVVVIDRFLIPLIKFPEKDDTMFLSTNLLSVELDKDIKKNYVDAAADLYYNEDKRVSYSDFADTDNDGLYDFEEINFSTDLISFKDNDKVKLPTFAECLASTNNAKIMTAMDIYADKSFYEDAMDKSILLVNSDPTSEDGDGDGILDFDEVAIIKEELRNSTSAISTFSTSAIKDSDGDGIPDDVENAETVLDAARTDTLIDIIKNKFGVSVFSNITTESGNAHTVCKEATLQSETSSPMYIKLTSKKVNNKIINYVELTANVNFQGKICTDNTEKLDPGNLPNANKLNVNDFFKNYSDNKVKVTSTEDMTSFIKKELSNIWVVNSSSASAGSGINYDFYKGMRIKSSLNIIEYTPSSSGGYIYLCVYANRCGISNASPSRGIKLIKVYDSYCGNTTMYDYYNKDNSNTKTPNHPDLAPPNDIYNNSALHCTNYKKKIYSPQVFVEVIAHELGHAFGLKDAYGYVGSDDKTRHKATITDGTITKEMRISVLVDKDKANEFNDYTGENGVMYGPKDYKVHLNDIEMILYNFTLSDYSPINTTQYYTPNVKTLDVLKKYNKEQRKITSTFVDYTINNANASLTCSANVHSLSPAIKDSGDYMVKVFFDGNNDNNKPDEIYYFKLYKSIQPNNDFITLDGYYGAWQ